MKIVQWFEGKKTFFLCAAGVVVIGAQWVGKLTPDQSKSLLEILGFGTAAALRSAVAKQ